MEIYKTLTEVINSIDFRIIYWQFQDSDDIYDRNVLLTLADQLEPIFNPEGLNYYMALPDGEILVLLMREKQIMTLFVPYEMQNKEAEAKPSESSEQESKTKPEVKFCPECGAPLKPGAKFCAECGKRVFE